MGEENYKNFPDHARAIHLLFSSVTGPHLRDQLLRDLQLCLYSLGKGYKLHFNHGEFKHEPFRFRMAAPTVP